MPAAAAAAAAAGMLRTDEAASTASVVAFSAVPTEVPVTDYEAQLLPYDANHHAKYAKYIDEEFVYDDNADDDDDDEAALPSYYDDDDDDAETPSEHGFTRVANAITPRRPAPLVPVPVSPDADATALLEASSSPLVHHTPPPPHLALDAALDVAPAPQSTSASTSTSTSTSTSISASEQVRAALSHRAEQTVAMAEAEDATRQNAHDSIAQPTRAHALEIAVPVPATPASPDSATGGLTVATPKFSLGNWIASFIPARILGITYLALSAIIFSIQALFVSLVSKTMPSFQIVFFRCFLQFCWGAAACYQQGVNILGPPDRRKWLFIRGLTGCSAFSFYYFAISHLTLADATTIFFTAPMYTGIFGYFFLSEKMARFDLVCAATSIIGVVMVVRPAFIFGSSSSDDATQGVSTADGNGATDVEASVDPGSAYHTAGIIAAIIGALISSAVYIAIRKVGPGVNPLVLVSYMGFIGALFSPFGGLAQTFVWPAEFTIWFYLFLIGCFSFLGQCLFNAGVQREKAGPASMIRNLDVAFSFLWQITIEGIAPNGWSVIGALIISGAVVAMGVKKWRQDSAKAVVTPAPPADPSAPPTPLFLPAVDSSLIDIDPPLPGERARATSIGSGAALYDVAVYDRDEAMGDRADDEAHRAADAILAANSNSSLPSAIPIAPLSSRTTLPISYAAQHQRQVAAASAAARTAPRVPPSPFTTAVKAGKVQWHA